MNVAMCGPGLGPHSSLLTHITHINHQQIAAGHPGPLGTVATKFALHEIILNANYVDTEK